MTHIEEMEVKQICVFRPAPNQYREGEIEICDAFWPYVKEEILQARSELQSFVYEVKELLRTHPCITCRFGSADLSFTEKLYVRSVPINQIRCALVLGCARKYVTLINSDDGELTGECQVLGWNQVCLLARRRVDNSVAISIQRSTSVFISS